MAVKAALADAQSTTQLVLNADGALSDYTTPGVANLNSFPNRRMR